MTWATVVDIRPPRRPRAVQMEVTSRVAYATSLLVAEQIALVSYTDRRQTPSKTHHFEDGVDRRLRCQTRTGWIAPVRGRSRLLVWTQRTLRLEVRWVLRLWRDGQ